MRNVSSENQFYSSLVVAKIGVEVCGVVGWMRVERFDSGFLTPKVAAA